MKWTMTKEGFTLLELLVAMSITAVISLMTYQGLSEMIKARGRLEQETQQLAALQNAMTILARDCEQIVARPIRDEYGSPRPALLGEAGGGGGVEFTRGGVSNPTGRQRSSQQRVAYRVNEGALIRQNWPVLDRVVATTPSSRPLLSGVEKWQIRYLDEKSEEWHNAWPPAGGDGLPLTSLPRAMEVTLELTGWGAITRLLLLAGPEPR